jgi:lipopolysaccharide export LptBFGC system permease protein LptF
MYTPHSGTEGNKTKTHTRQNNRTKRGGGDTVPPRCSFVKLHYGSEVKGGPKSTQRGVVTTATALANFSFCLCLFVFVFASLSLSLFPSSTRNISFHFSLTNVLISGYLAVIAASKADGKINKQR